MLFRRDLNSLQSKFGNCPDCEAIEDPRYLLCKYRDSRKDWFIKGLL